jgi:hypothetical protein
MQPPHAARKPAMLQVPLTLVKESVSTGAVATAFRTCLFRRAEGAAARVLRALPAKREVSAGWNALAPARRLMVATALAHFMVLLLCLGKEQSSAKAHTRLVFESFTVGSGIRSGCGTPSYNLRTHTVELQRCVAAVAVHQQEQEHENCKTYVHMFFIFCTETCMGYAMCCFSYVLQCC